MKPNPRIYEVVEEQSGRRGGELLYIDDRPENVEHGKQRGWQVIQHVSPGADGPACRRAACLTISVCWRDGSNDHGNSAEGPNSETRRNPNSPKLEYSAVERPDFRRI